MKLCCVFLRKEREGPKYSIPLDARPRARRADLQAGGARPTPGLEDSSETNFHIKPNLDETSWLKKKKKSQRINSLLIRFSSPEQTNMNIYYHECRLSSFHGSDLEYYPLLIFMKIWAT